MSEQEIPLSPEDENRRRWLVSALAAGAFSTAFPLAAQAFWGKRPKPMETGRQFFKIEGVVKVNGVVATLKTAIKPGDVVETGADSLAIFVVEKDAFSMRANSRIDIKANKNQLIVKAFSLISGAVLTVFGETGHTVDTPLATIGIRGTGVYMEVEENRNYICTCYGTVDLGAKNQVTAMETVRSDYHNARYVYANKPSDGDIIQKAPFINHTDIELQVLEALCGREVPFTLSNDPYEAPRRDPY